MPQHITSSQHLTDEEREAMRQYQIKRNQTLISLLDDQALKIMRSSGKRGNYCSTSSMRMIFHRPLFPPATP